MDTGVDRWTDVEGGIHIQRNLRLSRPFWDKDGGEDQNDDETRQMDRIREWQHWLKHGNLREQSTEYKISAPVCSLHTRLSNTIVKYPLLQSVLRWVDRPRRKRGCDCGTGADWSLMSDSVVRLVYTPVSCIDETPWYCSNFSSTVPE